MTREEIIAFINKILETNSDPFDGHTIIEDCYIYIPSVEFVRDATTGKWHAV